MPKFSDYKQAARARGSLGLELFAVISTPAVPPEEMQKHLPDHLAYQAQLEKDRVLFLAGPLSDTSGENIEGVGLIIYRAADLDAARAIAEADPMHARRARTYELRRWLVNEGSLRLDVGLSTGNAALA
ncbi:MAG: YciI family protein [Rhodobacter sp.]|nr:YciI family protein [Rhodobacter sp.]